MFKLQTAICFPIWKVNYGAHAFSFRNNDETSWDRFNCLQISLRVRGTTSFLPLPSARQSPHSPLLSFPAHLPTCTSSPHQHRSDVPPVFGVSAICICIWSVPVCFLLPVLDLIRFGLFCLFNSSLPCPSGFVCLFGWSMVHVFGSYLTLWQWY